ncbi:MAG TPA: DUF2946 domain-containing protein [Rhodospirillales bacterium]|nr:DUF2946 domain-containing protein [Rhodospirillales bacterium]
MSVMAGTGWIPVRRGGVLLALLGLLVQLVGASLAPATARSGRAEDGLARIVICSAYGTRTIYVDEAGREIPPPADEDRPSPDDCLFCRLVCGQGSLLPVPQTMAIASPPPATAAFPVAEPVRADERPGSHRRPREPPLRFL